MCGAVGGFSRGYSKTPFDRCTFAVLTVTKLDLPVLFVIFPPDRSSLDMLAVLAVVVDLMLSFADSLPCNKFYQF